MSTDHSAKVFYGTWTPLDSPAGKKLADYVDGHGYLPCRETGTTGVSIDRVGSAPTGHEQMAVYAHESALRYDPRESTPEPRPVAFDQEVYYRGAIADMLKRHEISPADMAPIGWYFAAKVS